jgi:hypothetical protein
MLHERDSNTKGMFKDPVVNKILFKKPTTVDDRQGTADRCIYQQNYYKLELWQTVLYWHTALSNIIQPVK